MWTNKDIEFLVNNYSSLGALACSDVLCKSPKQIRRKANKMKLKVSPSVKSLIQSKNALQNRRHETYNVDARNFMENITNESAYLLGLIWADGYLLNTKRNPHRISVEIQTTDFKIIENLFDLTGKWCKSKRKRPKRKEQSSAITNNKRLFQCLVEDYNYTEGVPDISKIPKSMLHYWFRGLFDGDGCFYFNEKRRLTQMSIAGPYNQDWRFLTSLLDDLNIKYVIKAKISKKGHKSSCVRVSNREGIIRFGQYIYQGDKFGLTRKRDKLRMIIDFYNKSILMSRRKNVRINPDAYIVLFD